MAEVSSANVIEDSCYRPWATAVEPFKITDQIFYVGNAWVGAYLIDSGEGLILLDTTVAETGYLVVDGIHQLGYDVRDIKLILLSHAHVDHYGSARFIKEICKAPIYMSKEDDAFRHTEAAAAASLGGPEVPFREYDFDVDEHFSDDKLIKLGCVEIRTKLTPGHTPGTTSFFIRMPAPDGKPGTIVAAMHGGVGVLTMKDAYFEKTGLSSELRRQFIRDCANMKSIPVDICLPSHPAHGNIFQMRDKSWADENPFINPAAWAEFLDNRVKFAIKLEEGK